MISFPSSALTSLMYYLWVELLHHVVKEDEEVVDSDHLYSLDILTWNEGRITNLSNGE